MPDGAVRLVIFNAMGQAVRHLVDGNRSAGYYKAVWDGRDDLGNALGSGMFLVKRQAVKFSAIRKVLLLR